MKMAGFIGTTRRGRWARRAVTSLLIAGMVIGGPWLASAQVQDVPQDHWAYESVTRLVSDGYLSTYDDGTFRGDQPVDRFTLAAAVHQLLRQVETGMARIDEADVELLRELATEFRDELVAFYAVRDDLLASVEDSQKKVAVFDETLNTVIDAIVLLETDAENLKGELARESEALRRLIAGETDALYVALAEEGESLRVSLHDEIDALWAALEQEREDRLALGERVGSHVETGQETLRGEVFDVIADLRSQAREQEDRLTQLETVVDETLEDTLWLSERVEDVYGQVGQLEERVGGMELQAGVDGALLGTLRADLTQLRTSLEELQGVVEEDWELADERLRRVETGITDIEQALEADREQLRADMADVTARLDDLQDRMAAADAALFLLDERISEEREDVTAAIRALMDEADLLLDTTEALIDDVEFLYGRLDQFERQQAAHAAERAEMESRLAHLEHRVGFSDEELSMLTDRVRDELEAQLNLALLREQRMQKELDDLFSEFQADQAAKEEEIKSLRGTTTIAIGVAILGLIVGFMN